MEDLSLVHSLSSGKWQIMITLVVGVRSSWDSEMLHQRLHNCVCAKSAKLLHYLHIYAIWAFVIPPRVDQDLVLAALAALYLPLVTDWVSVTLEFWHKYCLETLQTYGQSDKKTKKTKKNKKDKKGSWILWCQGSFALFWCFYLGNIMTQSFLICLILNVNAMLCSFQLLGWVCRRNWGWVENVSLFHWTSALIGTTWLRLLSQSVSYDWFWTPFFCTGPGQVPSDECCSIRGWGIERKDSQAWGKRENLVC